MVKAPRRNSSCQVEKISRPVRECAKKPGEQAEEADEKVERKTKYSREYAQPKETKANKDELNCYKLFPRKNSKTFNMMNLIEMGKFEEKALEGIKMVKQVAGRAVDVVVISTGVALQWAYAIFALQVRMKSLPGDRPLIRMPTDEELMNGSVRLARKRMEYWTCRHMEQMEYCEDALDFSTVQRIKAEKRIESIINAGFRSQTLAAEDSRILLQITDDVRMFVDSGIEDPFKKMTDGMYHEHIKENVVDENEKDLVADHRKLNRFSEEFDCKCTNGCTKDCPCAIMNKAFYEGAIHDPEFIRHYGCSESCNCKGKCKKAFPKPPANSTEIVFHHRTAKGFALVAKQFFAPGEPVAEMRGEYCRTNTAPKLDQYIIDITTNDIEEIYKAYFQHNRQSPDGVGALSPDYEEALKAVIKSGISLNPRNKSSEGRFASSSCLGNTKVNFVHERGVSPTNARVIFTATMPIFPTQEVTWFYSDQYIWEQLRNVCLCGELCCVTNVKLFPFITDAQLLKFHKTIYESQLEQFLENTK